MTSPKIISSRHVLLGLTLLASIHGTACTVDEVPAGAERGPCRSDQTCDEGLVCLSDTCVAEGSEGTSDGGTDAGPSEEMDGGDQESPDAGAMDADAPDATTFHDQCNPVEQTGCEGVANGKCVVEVGPPGTSCEVASQDDVGLGESCMGGDCLPGLACLVATATVSICRQVCDPATNTGCESLGAGYECRTRILESNWGACSMLPPTCDPYTQAPCDADHACQPFLTQDGAWEFRCRTAGNGAEGMACGGQAGCERGLACVNGDNGAMCVKYCEDEMDCVAPATCSGSVPDPEFSFCE